MMTKSSTWERNAQLAVVLLCAFTLKQYYSAASVNELRWILAPTTLAVELVSGSRFDFESYAGYVKSDHTFVIAGSCAGVNFLITAFLLLALGRLWRNRSSKIAWRSLLYCAAAAYVATIVANTVRITTALQLHGRTFGFAGFSPNELHRLQGIFIYFGFLLLLFVLSERLAVRTASESVTLGSAGSAQASSRWQRFLFPLVIYYATTLGLPIANAIIHRRSAGSGFWEHANFVLLAPLVVLGGFALCRVAKSSLSASSR